jgi:hypothetical protein
MDANATLRKFSIVLFILFLLAFCIKVFVNSFASNLQSTSSIVQYSVLTLCLLFSIGCILNALADTASNPRKNGNNFAFLFGMTWVLGNVIAFIALNGDNIDMLNAGHLKPSINSAFNVYWIIVPQFMLIFYNLKLFMDCNEAAPCNKVSWITLVILAFALIQTYLIVDSSRVIKYWPTDDGLRNIPKIQI